MNERLTASVVLPVHNQADHLESVVEAHLRALRDLPMTTEIVLVPNACRDATADISRRLAERHDEVRVVELVEGGWGRAVKAGLREASGDLLCYTNSARTTTEMLTLALLFASVHPDVVVKANRRVRDSLVRRVGSVIYNLEARWLFELAEWDVNGTPKVFPRACAALLELDEDGDLIDLEFVARCHAEGYRVVELPLLAFERHGGRSTTNWRSAFDMYTGAWRLARRLGRP